MEKNTPVDEIAMNEDSFRSLFDAIGDLRRQIEALKKDAETGGKFDSADTGKMLFEFNRAVVACGVAENRLHECRNKQAGIARGGYAIDMDRARAEIGCKLDRIRQCGDPGAIPERA